MHGTYELPREGEGGAHRRSLPSPSARRSQDIISPVLYGSSISAAVAQHRASLSFAPGEGGKRSPSYSAAAAAASFGAGEAPSLGTIPLPTSCSKAQISDIGVETKVPKRVGDVIAASSIAQVSGGKAGMPTGHANAAVHGALGLRHSILSHSQPSAIHECALEPQQNTQKRSTELWKKAKTVSKATSVYSGFKVAMKAKELEEEMFRDMEDDWEQKEWIPPKRELAHSRAAQAKFWRGKAPFRDTGLEQLEELGEGVVIYFQVLRVVAIYFSVMSLIALPSIFLSRQGTYMEESGEIDFFQMLTFTLGNVNVYNSSTIAVEEIGRETSLLVQSGECADEHCIEGLKGSVFGFDWTLQPNQIGMAFVVCDLLYCLVFLFLVAIALPKVIARALISAKHGVQASNYAVFVTGLPVKATENEVRKHFSQLFDLTRVLEKKSSRRNSMLRELGNNAMRRGSWLLGIDYSSPIAADEYHVNDSDSPNGGTPPFSSPLSSPGSDRSRSKSRSSPRKPSPQEILRRLRKPQPVVDMSFPGDENYLGGWVAEVSIAHSNGEALRRYLKAEKDHERLIVRRARVQMYSAPSSAAHERRRAQALARAQDLSQKIKTVHENQGLPNLMDQKGLMERCCGAFVLFNNRESQQLCLESYAKSHWLWGRCFQADKLKFVSSSGAADATGSGDRIEFSGKEVRLSVEQAPNPSNILWENLHCSELERSLRSYTTNLITLLLLALSTFVLYRMFGTVEEIEIGGAGEQGGDSIMYKIVNFGTILDLPMTGGLISIVIMNHVLRLLLRWMQGFERPTNLTKAESILAAKMFISEFLNTAVVILLATGFDNLREDGFSFQLYTSVGQDIMYAVVYLAVFPHLYRLLDHWCLRPSYIRWKRSACATQMEMDALYAGPDFQLGDRYSDILLTVFVSLSYSGGMPILLPCAAATFWAFYYSDWYLLLRYYSKPAMYDDQLARDFCSFLSYALMLHALGTALAVGNSIILPVTSPTDSLLWLIPDSGVLRASEQLQIYLTCIIPLIVLSMYPKVLSRLFSCADPKGTSSSSAALLDPIFTGVKVFPSYTGVYFQVVDPNRRLTDEQWELEKEMGIAQIDNGIVYRTWDEDGEFHGVKHKVGQKRNTWECIHDYSYRISAVPRYRRAAGLMTRDLRRALEKHFSEDERTTDSGDTNSTSPV